MAAAVPRVGLVLGAGGVVGGAFHAGVLAAIAEGTGWDPRTATIVVGTSAGSIAAASLRAGLSAADMLARAQDLPLSTAGQRLLAQVGPPAHPPAFRPARRGGLSPSQVAGVLGRAVARPFAARPMALLAGLLPEGAVSTDLISGPMGALFPSHWPDAPLWLCTVRQRDGRRVVFGRGDRRGPLPDVVAASCAIPSFFTPVMIDGEAYVDGGVHSPTNADVLRREDLDLVLVVSPMSVSGRGLRVAVDQPVRRWSAALLDTEARRLRREGMHVVAFQPTRDDASVMGANAMDPSRRAAVAGHARESTLRRLSRADTRSRLAPLISG
jgi:NTE family protein